MLIAPLDWGLGHATRCIPIIRKLLLFDYEVIIAADGAQAHLLQSEFPSLKCFALSGYRLSYSDKNFLTSLKIIAQIPKILTQINREKEWLEKIIVEEKIDIMLSDNRYGLHSKKIISIFLTHQLYIKTPFGRIAEKILQRLNYKYINQFSCCWVPDFEEKNILAGELSHPKKLPKIPVRYIGLLSRFEKKETPYIYDQLILLSGPEPQRTVLENIFLSELNSFDEKTILVRGLPNEKNELTISSKVEILNHLSASALNEKILQSKLVICRSGYSTMMDLARLGKPCVVIPTAGQSEQEYLANYLSEKKLALKFEQEKISLNDAIKVANQFPFVKYVETENNLLADAIKEMIDYKK